jgi:hypothetical protein
LTALPKGMQWAGGDSDRARFRRMRQSHARVLKLKDKGSLCVLGCLRAAVADDPDPLAAEIRLAHAGILAADQTRQPWAVAMGVILLGFEENAEEAEVEGLVVDPRTGLPG